jgi:AraC family transcriptional regulator
MAHQAGHSSSHSRRLAPPRWVGVGHAGVVLHFFRPLLESIADELSVRGKFDFFSVTTGADGFGMELLGNIGREVRSQTRFSRVYLESLFRVFAAHMTRAYSDAKYARASKLEGLSPRQLRAVDDFIHAHLNQSTGLSALATVAGLSSQRFLSAFRHSTGQAPHQYLLARRIQMAKQWLAAGKMSLLEIAFELGFSSQSHFGAVFRRVVGASPGRYRDAIRQ